MDEVAINQARHKKTGGGSAERGREGDFELQRLERRKMVQKQNARGALGSERVRGRVMWREVGEWGKGEQLVEQMQGCYQC